MNVPKAIGCGVALALMVSCHSETRPPVDSGNDASVRAAVEARAARVFTNAILIKPSESGSTNHRAFALAPLLIQEVEDSSMGSNSGPAEVFYQPGAVQIAGITRPQMTYLWACGDEKRLGRGVRLTLDSRGLPVVWEVLDDLPGTRVVFVSQSLEEKAKAAYGSPAAGRRFAVEQELRVAPDVVVARVIEEGPVAMGPMVHLTASQEVSTVICRCMAPQVRQLLATAYYEFKPLAAMTNVGPAILGTNRSLVEKLRLPPAF